MKISTVSLIGLGAMGSFFAPLLGKHLGTDFRVIAGGERKERLESQGITVNGTPHRFTVVTPETTGDPADLVIVAVKNAGLPQAIADIKNQVGKNTQILCVMNGVDSEERIAAVYGWDHVIYSYMRVSGAMKNGAATVDMKVGKVHFGEAKNDTLSERVAAVKELFDRCGLPYQIEPDMIRGLWFKFMCNVGENMTCALLGVPIGAFHSGEDANLIRHKAMGEVIAIANRKGILLGQEDVDRQDATIARIPFHVKPSTLQDLENGRKTEVDMFAGKVLSMGQELGIDTPVNWMLYHGIKVLEEKLSFPAQ